MSHALYQFSGERLGPIEWCDPVRGGTLVADSWLVDQGQAVAVELHRERFIASCQDSGVDGSLVRSFFRAVLDQIPREGTWFPRVELVATPGGPTLRYRERVAPERLETAVVKVSEVDPRTQPMTKGPDLEALLALRAQVAPSGANEALIQTDSGILVEGAYSTLMMWPPGRDQMVVVEASLPRIPSVTESVLRDVATERGIPVSEREIKTADLAGWSVWVISALHGIRLVTNFIEGPPLAVHHEHRDDWQKAWWGRRTPLVANGYP